MSLTPEVALAVSVWVEAVIYGIYACLFFEALYIMLKKRSTTVGSAKVFLVGTTLMFLLATAHIVVNLYRFIRAFVLQLEPLGPYFYLFDFRRWDTRTHNVMLCLMTWLGDGLVIYRCYVVWDRKLWVTVVPVILLLLSICTNAILLFWFTHPNVEHISEVFHWLGTVYPFAFAQNTITTGMISFKIWRQHRASRTMGVVNSSSLDLLGVMRIIIESAMIYTFQLLVLIILFPLHHNAQYIVQDAVIPSIGIVFVLIAVRVHFSKSRTLFGAATVMASLPSWLHDDSSSTQDDEEATPRRSLVVQVADNLALAQPKETIDFISSRQAVSAP